MFKVPNFLFRVLEFNYTQTALFYVLINDIKNLVLRIAYQNKDYNIL